MDDVTPENWEIGKLNDVVDFTRKPRSLALSELSVVPYLPMDLIPSQGTWATEYMTRTPQEITSGVYCEPGDILLAKITPCFENGKQGILGDIPFPFAYATTEVFPLKVRPDRIDKFFLFSYLRMHKVRKGVAEKMEGTTGRQRIPKSVIENLEIPLPPLPEQRRIAAVLNTIQVAIAAQEDVIAAAKTFKRSLMQRLFTYGPGREPAETKETEIGEIPTDWVIESLGKLCDNGGTIQTGPFGSQLHASDYVLEGIPTVMPQDMVDNRISTANIARISLSDHQRLARHHLQAGDIVYARRGDIGRRALVSASEAGWLCGTGSLVIRARDPNIDPSYLYYYLGRKEVIAYILNRAVGSTMLNLNTRIVGSVPVAFPVRIADQKVISEAMTASDVKIAAEEDRLTALQSLFKSMLHQFMTGQIRLLSDEVFPLSDATSNGIS